MTDEHESLKRQVERQVDRLQRAQSERRTVLAETAYLGTLGVLFVLPVIVGAYLGRWLDGLVEGYSIRWTLSLIIVGVFIGGINVYLFVRRDPGGPVS